MTFSFQKGMAIYKSTGKLQVETKKTSQIKVKVFESAPLIASRDSGAGLPRAKPEDKVYSERSLLQIVDTASLGRYLNLTSHQRKDLKPRAVMTKYILDHGLVFSPSMEALERVYFTFEKGDSDDRVVIIHMLEERSQKVTTIIRQQSFEAAHIDALLEQTDEKQSEVISVGSQFELVDAFTDKLRELSQNTLVIAIGFDVLTGGTGAV